MLSELCISFLLLGSNLPQTRGHKATYMDYLAVSVGQEFGLWKAAPLIEVSPSLQ